MFSEMFALFHISHVTALYQLRYKNNVIYPRRTIQTITTGRNVQSSSDHSCVNIMLLYIHVLLITAIVLPELNRLIKLCIYYHCYIFYRGLRREFLNNFQIFTYFYYYTKPGFEHIPYNRK